MTHMVEKQVFIAPEQAKRVKRLSNTLGVSEGELIRKAISSYLDSSQDSGRHEAKRSPDRRGWLKELEFMKSRIESRTVAGGYPHRITREEMYDEILEERGLLR